MSTVNARDFYVERGLVVKSYVVDNQTAQQVKVLAKQHSKSDVIKITQGDILKAALDVIMEHPEYVELFNDKLTEIRAEKAVNRIERFEEREAPNSKLSQLIG